MTTKNFTIWCVPPQGFQQEITLNTNKIDALIVFGENLIQKSAPLDAVLIEDELEELHSYCQEVFGRVARFHHRLVNRRPVSSLKCWSQTEAAFSLDPVLSTFHSVSLSSALMCSFWRRRGYLQTVTQTWTTHLMGRTGDSRGTKTRKFQQQAGPQLNGRSCATCWHPL